MMRGSRAVTLALVLGLLAVPQATAASPPPSSLAPQIAGVDADSVHIEAAIATDGSARWTVEYHFLLSDDSASNAFDDLGTQIENDPDPVVDEFLTNVRGLAATAQNATGRAMVVENGSVSTRRAGLAEDVGVVAFEVRWYGFAATGSQVRAGDVLDAMFLPEGTHLTLSWADGLERKSVTPNPDGSGTRSVTWDGPTGFATGEPRLVLGGNGPFGPAAFGAGSDDVMLAGILLVLPFALVGTVVLGRRHAGPITSSASGSTGDSGQESGAAAGDGDRDGDGGDDGPPSDLLSNEEQVLTLVEGRGGRMKQQDVVGELGWSETKTSEVVAALREADELEVYRLGRENVLALPGESGFEIGPADDEDRDDGEGDGNDEAGQEGGSR